MIVNIFTILRIMNNFGPKTLIALTKRKEKRYHISKSSASTILYIYIDIQFLLKFIGRNEIYLTNLAEANKSGRTLEPKCNPIPI